MYYIFYRLILLSYFAFTITNIQYDSRVAFLLIRTMIDFRKVAWIYTYYWFLSKCPDIFYVVSCRLLCFNKVTKKRRK